MEINGMEINSKVMKRKPAQHHRGNRRTRGCWSIHVLKMFSDKEKDAQCTKEIISPIAMVKNAFTKKRFDKQFEHDVEEIADKKLHFEHGVLFVRYVEIEKNRKEISKILNV